ncbi:MAG: TVP38/TMEM64 family protein [Alphaproteobacteria bacterium]
MAGETIEAAKGRKTMETAGKAEGSMFRRLLPLLILAIVAALVFASGLHEYLSFDALREHREFLLASVHDHPILAALLFVAVYAVATAISIPGGAVLTIAGGFLFGTWLGGFYVVIGATLGAAAIFLIAKTSLGSLLKSKAGPWLQRMEDGFRDNALSYLLFLRLIPVFPFWLVNLVPAFLGVGLTTFVIGTFVGIIPGSLVFASVGNGLGAVFDAGGTPDLGIIFEPSILGPILALSVLALIPIAYKRFVRKKME